jgi:hypothetical protein
MRRRLAVLIAAAALLAWPVAQAPARPGTPVVAAKVCSTGYKHAVIEGAQKCLRRGQFCAHRYDRQYRRYGYRCLKRDYRGNYHLT